MPSCDTCALLIDPPLEEHAKSYYLCSWRLSEPMPSAVLHLERMGLERIDNSARWVTRKIVNEKPELLPQCPCWRAK